MSIICKCSMSLSPAIFALRNTKVHISVSDSIDVMTNAKTPFDYNFIFYVILRISDICYDLSYELRLHFKQRLERS